MADKPFWINLLDMGPDPYGDSILIHHPETRILIDGGYAALASDRPGVPSLPSQLGSILGKKPPYRIDLLVVTHCHGDHIGCLPQLVTKGILEVEWALVADPDLGFPSLDARTDMRAKLLATALQDEPHDQLADAELIAYLQDALTLEERYRAMLDQLQAAGTRVRRYGRDDTGDLEREFGPRGLAVLGPTIPHLEHCRDFLIRLLRDGLTRLGDLALPDTAGTLADQARMYRQIVRGILSDEALLESDRPGRGAALNDQSIVLLFESNGAKALLTGDMQLAEPEVPGLDAAMAALLRRLKDFAPFDFVKTAHHSSYNGLNTAVLDALPAKVLGHTGGQGSSAHPSRSVLDLLKMRSGEFDWVRTDRNGRVGILLGDGPSQFFLSRGHRNDFRLPVKADEPPSVPQPAPAALRTTLSPAVADEVIEITARIPNRTTRVTITVDVQPGETRVTSTTHDRPEPRTLHSPDPALSLGGGRELPRLLFATSERLGKAVGDPAQARDLLDRLRATGHHVIDTLPHQPLAAPAAAAEVRAFLDGLDPTRPAHGVVLLGNYDVVPSIALDTLDPELRANVRLRDPDRFVVWSDDPYGDADGDGIPELAVSRVLHEPGSSDLLRRSLSAQLSRGEQRFGMRNVHRPFAEDVFSLLPGAETLHVSAPIDRYGLPPRATGSAADYFMLHGSAHDASLFWGEAEDGDGEIEAFHLENVPPEAAGITFSGCCWGALPVDSPASNWRPPTHLAPRTRENSIAVRYLAAGVRGFVGCTGAHYSPGSPPYSYFGAPFHQTFWTHVGRGYPPALALLFSKRLYAASIPHVEGSADYVAVELKIFQQFTCLGLGW